VNLRLPVARFFIFLLPGLWRLVVLPILHDHEQIVGILKQRNIGSGITIHEQEIGKEILFD
jgi:hypothetical protein